MTNSFIETTITADQIVSSGIVPIWQEAITLGTVIPKLGVNHARVVFSNKKHGHGVVIFCDGERWLIMKESESYRLKVNRPPELADSIAKTEDKVIKWLYDDKDKTKTSADTLAGFI
jgi:hypothetical protein